MVQENFNSQEEYAPQLRIDKTIEWMIHSRNEWKQKCLEAKLKLKRQTLETKRAREGRKELKSTLRAAQKQITTLKNQLEKKDNQIDELKKKL